MRYMEVGFSQYGCCFFNTYWRGHPSSSVAEKPISAPAGCARLLAYSGSRIDPAILWMAAGIMGQPGAPRWAQARHSLKETGSSVTSHRKPSRPVWVRVGVVTDIPRKMDFLNDSVALFRLEEVFGTKKKNRGG